ncbi:MAG: PspA/IM30 family protein [Streptosporangiaceae bacterium]
MSVMKRVTLIFRSKANKALDRMEDPRETLDYSYQRQLEMLQKVRRGVADVATSRKRVELQMNQIQQQSNKLEKQARDALGAGREDLAREALTRRSSAQSQLNDLQAQYASLQAEEEKLTIASQRLQSKVDAFRTRKETIKATYTAAEAQTRINEAFSGISEEMGDVGMAIQRAEDKTAQMQARAGAIDELLASGALEDVSGTPRDDIQAELDRMGAGNDVELELQKLRGELSAGSTPELEAGPPGGSDGNAARNSSSGRTAAPPASDGVQPSAGHGAPTASEQVIPASDVGESAIPSADPPRTSDQP